MRMYRRILEKKDGTGNKIRKEKKKGKDEGEDEVEVKDEEEIEVIRNTKRESNIIYFVQGRNEGESESFSGLIPLILEFTFKTSTILAARGMVKGNGGL